MSCQQPIFSILAGRGSRTPHQPYRRSRIYALRGVLLCGLCDRRMTGNRNNDQAYYRCRFPAECALANRVDHPKTAAAILILRRVLYQPRVARPVTSFIAMTSAGARSAAEGC